MTRNVEMDHHLSRHKDKRHGQAAKHGSGAHNWGSEQDVIHDALQEFEEREHGETRPAGSEETGSEAE